jgi:hypothetical protein
MNLNHHVVEIQAPPEAVFTSITAGDGPSTWWSTKRASGHCLTWFAVPSDYRDDCGVIRLSAAETS